MFVWFGAGDRVFDEPQYALHPLISKVSRIAVHNESDRNNTDLDNFNHHENRVILLRAQ